MLRLNVNENAGNTLTERLVWNEYHTDIYIYIWPCRCACIWPPEYHTSYNVTRHCKAYFLAHAFALFSSTLLFSVWGDKKSTTDITKTAHSAGSAGSTASAATAVERGIFPPGLIWCRAHASRIAAVHYQLFFTEKWTDERRNECGTYDAFLCFNIRLYV